MKKLLPPTKDSSLFVRHSSDFLCTFVGVMEKKRHALRKLLEAVEKEILRRPDRKTLDRLSLLAGFQDWESFQEALHGEAGGETNFDVDGKRKEAS